MTFLILLVEQSTDAIAITNVIMSIIGTIGGVGLPIYIAVSNNSNKKKEIELKEKIAKSEEKQNNKLDEKFNIIIERQVQNDDTMNRFEKLLQNHLNEDYLEKDIKKVTIDVVANVNKDNPMIPDEHKSVISYWGNLIEKLANNYFKSPQRKQSKRLREKILLELKREMMAKFENYLDSEFVSIKNFMNTPVKLKDFMVKRDIYRGFEKLIDALEINGKTNDEILELFSDQVDLFCFNYMKMLGTWNELKEWDGSTGQQSGFAKNYKDFD